MPQTKEEVHASIIRNCYTLRDDLAPILKNLESEWKHLARVLRGLRECIRNAQGLLCPPQLWEDRQAWIRAREHDAGVLAQAIEQLARLTQQLRAQFPERCATPCCEHCPTSRESAPKKAPAETGMAGEARVRRAFVAGTERTEVVR